jgi:hypothetical protein
VQVAGKFVNDAIAFRRWRAIPALLIVVRRKRDIDKMPTGGIKVKPAIVVRPTRNRRERSVLAQNLAHFRRYFRSQSPLRNLGDDRMAFRPPRVRLCEQSQLDEAGDDEFLHGGPRNASRRAAIRDVKTS